MSDPRWQPTLWESVLDEVLSGLLHELNGRVAGLSGVFQLLLAEGALDDELRPLMEREIQGLEDAVTLLRRVPRRPTQDVEAVRIGPLVSSLAELLRHRRGSTDVPVRVHEAGEPPIAAVDWNGASRVLLALLTAACRLAEARSAGCVEVRCEREGDGAVVGVTVPAAPAAPAADTDPATGGARPVTLDLAALRSLATSAGAELDAAIGEPAATAEARFALRFGGDTARAG